MVNVFGISDRFGVVDALEACLDLLIWCDRCFHIWHGFSDLMWEMLLGLAKIYCGRFFVFGLDL